MSPWQSFLIANPVPWLLEPDECNPGVRYWVLRDLLDLPEGDPHVIAAQAEVMRSGAVPAILEAQSEAGYWAKPGAGYVPKYRGTLWSLLFLAQLGADGRDTRVSRGVDYAFGHAQTEHGAFSCNGRSDAALYCLWGNMLRALLDLGYWEDERLDRAIDGLARCVIGDDFEGYGQRGIQGPHFLCSANDGRPCAWGAVRALWGLVRVPAPGRTPVVDRAIEACTSFLLRYDVARASYPPKYQVSLRWFRFGYPLGYVTDLLLNLEALTEAQCADDPRLGDAVGFVLSKQDEQGRWKMEHGYRGKMWQDIEKLGRPSKWVTLRALRVLKRIYGEF
jgi:hypothetical protein